jgi:hypothetical protein
MPVDVEVESEATLLLVVLSPVDSEFTPLCAVLMPVEVEVDKEATLLFVVLRPVDSEATLLPAELRLVESDATPLCAVLTPVDNELTLVEVEVDRLVMLETVVLATEYNWLPLMASVLLALTRPAATFWIRRSVPGAPTLTTPAAELAPAYVPKVWPPIVVLLTVPVPPVAVVAVPAVTALAPSATEPATLALAPLPTATLLAPDADALVPAANASTPVAPSLL